MAHDERAISELLDALTQALFKKDAASAIAPLADDAVTFDLAPYSSMAPTSRTIRRGLKNGLGRGKDPSFPSRASELSSSTKMWPTPLGYNG